jgi:ubiquinone/menaquinone biosynthesis C-methylase UbiE
METVDSQAIAEQNQKAYSALAVSYAEQWVKKPDIKLADQFLAMLNGNRILDVGCGPGHYSSYFIDRGYRVEAIDTSAEMLRLAVERDPRIQARMLDMTKLDYDESQFDGLWVCASLPHIPKELVGAVLRDFRRVLKRDGYLFVNAIIGNLDHRIETPQEMGPNYGKSGRFFQWYPSTDRFKEILEQSGFSVQINWQRHITSQVLKDALLPTNLWYNCFCSVES